MCAPWSPPGVTPSTDSVTFTPPSTSISEALPLSLEPLLGSIFTWSMRGSAALGASGSGFGSGFSAAVSTAGGGGGAGGAAGGSVAPPPHAVSKPNVPNTTIAANDEVFTGPPYWWQPS